MSFNYDRYDRRQPPAARRSAFGYWVPLVFTLTVASAGLAAWVWSERRDDHDESSDDDNLSYGEDSDPRDPRHPNHNPANPALHRDLTGMSSGVARPDDANLMARVQGVIRRTPSPQQVFDTVSKKTAAGWAAAGAALASIREEDKDDFGDHNRWSEEAAVRRNVEAQSAQSGPAVDAQARAFAASVRGTSAGGKRKTVVLVVSAEALNNAHDDDDASYRSENATILSHLPDTDPATTRLFVLIYSPTLRSRPQSRTGSSSLGGSYSAISLPARTSSDELAPVDPHADDTIYTPAMSTRSSDNLLWNTLHAQALRLVDHPAMAMPFSTPSGFVHMLRHIAPDLVYVVDALSGPNGANIEDVKRWVGQTIVVVGADGTGLGGLVDTDDEDHMHKRKATEHAVSHWWESADMVGLGKGVEVVDASRLADDFETRVRGAH